MHNKQALPSGRGVDAFPWASISAVAPTRGRRLLPSLACVATLGVSISASPAVAQAVSNQHPSPAPQVAEAQPSTGVADIVVTAERRSTSLQRTPIAVTALTGEALAEKQIYDIRAAQALVPSFKAGDAQGVAQFTIRGIGSSSVLGGAEGAVAVNLNEVYISRPTSQLTGLFDAAAIEVLRGPQGTLYGRNATAGSVNITTARPTDRLEGFARLAVGNYDTFRIEGAIGGPVVSDKLLVRVAAFRETHGGYGKNVVTGNDIDDRNAVGARATIVFKPTPGIKATVIGEYYREHDNSTGFHYFGAAGLTGLQGALGVPPTFLTDGGYSVGNFRNVANGLDPKFKLETKAVTGIVEFGEGPLTVKSITGYRDQDVSEVYPADGGSTLNLYLDQGEPAHQFSQELALNYSSSKFNITAGGYFFKEQDDVLPVSAVVSSSLINHTFGLTLPTDYFVNFASFAAKLSTNAKAAFVQGTYQVTPKLSLTAGIRYSYETKGDTQYYAIDLTTPYTGANPLPPGNKLPKASYKSTTPRLGLQYQIDGRTLLYASFAKGFKAGGYDTAVLEPVPHKQEKLTSYELGLKNTFLNGRLRANLAGYYYDYGNLQVQQVIGLAVQTSNAATARIYGMEGEFTYLPTAALRFDLTGSYTHARYRNYIGPDPARPLLPTVDFSGNKLSNAPTFQGFASAQYSWSLPHGKLRVRGEVEYSGKFYFSPANLDLLGQTPFAKANFFINYDVNDRFEIGAFVRNATNKITKTSAVVVTPLVGNPVQGAISPPRTIGVTVQYKL